MTTNNDIIFRHSQQCLSCFWFIGRLGDVSLACFAFPNGIPMDIYEGRILHTSPQEGDRGLRFEPAVDHPEFLETVEES